MKMLHVVLELNVTPHPLTLSLSEANTRAHAKISTEYNAPRIETMCRIPLVQTCRRKDVGERDLTTKFNL